MKRPMVVLVLLIGVVAVLSPIGWWFFRHHDEQTAIGVVQNASFNEDISNGTLVARITGTTGNTQWESFQPDGKPDHVRAVDANISLGKHNAVIQWLVNTDTKYVELHAIEVDTQQMSYALGVLKLLSWAVAGPDATENGKHPARDIVGKWQGDLEGDGFMDVTTSGNGYAVKLQVVSRESGCGGEVTGEGKLNGETLTISVPAQDIHDPTKRTACNITIRFDGEAANVEESNCLAFHGASCGFDGILHQVSHEYVAAPPRTPTSSNVEIGPPPASPEGQVGR